MELNPRQLEAFRAVMMAGSMTVAAEVLRVTQPAVSRLIKDLERDLRFRLFRREGNKLIPTQEGTILFAEVDRFYVGMERIGKIATDLRHTRAGTVRVAAMGALSLSCLTEAIAIFKSARPAVSVTLESLNSLLILDLVAGRHFDIGFAQAGGPFPGVDLIPLPPVDAVCVLPPDHPVASKELVTPEDLYEAPFISLGKNSPFRLKIDQVFQAANVPRREQLETSLAATVIGLVAQGVGVSIVDPFSASTFANDRYVVRPFSPRITFDVHAVSPTHQNSRLSIEFLKIVRSLFRSTQAKAGK